MTARYPLPTAILANDPDYPHIDHSEVVDGKINGFIDPFVDIIEASGDLVTDDTEWVQEALDLAASLEIPMVRFSKDDLFGRLDVPSNVIIDCQGHLLKQKAGSNASIFELDGVENVTIRNVVVDGNLAENTGCRAFRTKGGSEDCVFESFLTTNASVIADDNSKRTRLIRGQMSGQAVLQVSNGAEDTRVEDVHVTECTSTDSGIGAFYFTGDVRTVTIGCVAYNNEGNGFWCGSDSKDGTHIAFRSIANGGSLERRGFTIDGSLAVKFLNCVAELNSECGFFVSEDAAGVVFTACRAEKNNQGLWPGGHGFECLAPTLINACEAYDQKGSDLQSGCGIFIGGGGSVITGCQAWGNWAHGLRLWGAGHSSVNGGRFFNNSQSGAGDHHGIEINYSAPGIARDIAIIGVTCYDGQVDKTQGYGIADQGNASFYAIVGCCVLGNVTGGIAGLGTNKELVANID